MRDVNEEGKVKNVRRWGLPRTRVQYKAQDNGKGGETLCRMGGKNESL